MNPLDVLGHLFYGLVMLGTIGVGQRSRVGWIFRAVGHVGWVGIGLALGMTSIILWDSVFVLIDIRAWRKWRKEVSYE